MQETLTEVEALEMQLGLLRFELANVRPQLPRVKRPFTYQEAIVEQGYNIRWEWVTKEMDASLQAFGAPGGCEARAYDLGQLIKLLKQDILALGGSVALP